MTRRNLPAREGQPAVARDTFRADVMDATNVKNVDEQRHRPGCKCGCEGDVLIISEPGREGAYIASTVSVRTYYRVTDEYDIR